MEQNTVEIYKGLRVIFVGLLLNLLTFLSSEVAFAASILSFGITVSGLIFAARGDRKYLIPLVLQVVNTLGLEMLILNLTGMVVFWLAVARLAVTTVTLCLICAITLPWVRARRDGKPSRLGQAAFVGCAASGTVVLAFNLLAGVPGQELFVAILSLAGMALLAVTAVIYMVFLWQAGTLLK